MVSKPEGVFKGSRQKGVMSAWGRCQLYLKQGVGGGGGKIVMPLGRSATCTLFYSCNLSAETLKLRSDDSFSFPCS